MFARIDQENKQDELYGGGQCKKTNVKGIRK